jgi:hypothetical protein
MKLFINVGNVEAVWLHVDKIYGESYPETFIKFRGSEKPQSYGGDLVEKIVQALNE